jgi:hypothetical protein
MPLLFDITKREIARMHDRMIAGVLAYYTLHTYLHLQMFVLSCTIVYHRQHNVL